MKEKLFIAHATFIFTGVVNTLLGPALPILSVRWSLNDAQAGRLFTAQFLGAIVGTLASSRFMTWLGCRRTAMLGLILMAIGVAGTAAQTAPMGVAAILCFGLGLGLVVPATNLWVALVESDRSASALNLLNATWCIGAIAAAPLVIFFASRIGLAATLGALAILILSTAMSGIFGHDSTRPAPGVSLARAEPSADKSSGQGPAPKALAETATAHRWFIVLIAAILFFYVGTESGIGGWVTMYAKRFNLIPAANIGLAQSIFYGALMLGRLVAPFLLLRMKAPQLVLAGIAVAAAGLAFSLASPQSMPALVGLFIAGAGLAAIFPTTVSIFSDRLGANATRIAGWIFAIGNLGAATLPSLMGQVSDGFHSLRSGMLVPLAAIVAMFILQIRLIRMLRQRRTGAKS